MIIVCANCGQNMEGTPDMLDAEVRCPNCREWTRPQLPRAEAASRPTAVRPPTPGAQTAPPPVRGGAAVRPRAAEPPQIEPELMGQERLDDLVGAGEETGTRQRRGRRRVRKKPTKNLWYVLTDSGPKGPYAKEQITEFARQGQINQANNLRNATTGVDCPAGDVPGLFAKPAKSAKKAEPPVDPEWYIKTKNGQAGPFTGHEIVAFAKAGKINAATMLRKGHAGNFAPAGGVPGLFPDKS